MMRVEENRDIEAREDERVTIMQESNEVEQWN